MGIAIHEIARRRVLWCLALHAVGFTAAVTFLPPEIYFPVLQAMRLSIAVVLVLTFSRGITAILMQRELDQGSQLILGILCAWSAEIAISAWALAWRITDQSWMLNSPILAALLYMKVLGGTMHITAPRALDGRVPRRSWIMLMVGVTVAALLAGIVIGARWSDAIVRFI